MIKLSIKFILFLFILFGCRNSDSQEATVTDSNLNYLQGYWEMSTSYFKNEIPAENNYCPTPDAWHEPFAFGSHVQFKEDSVSIFNYPNKYFGTFKYNIADSLIIIKSNLTSTFEFKIQKSNESVFFITFNEAVSPECLLMAYSEYKRFTPNPKIIKLLKEKK